MLDLINPDELIAYCEQCADTSKELHQRVLSTVGHGSNEQQAISAMAWFMQQEFMYRYEIPNMIKSFCAEKEGKSE